MLFTHVESSDHFLIRVEIGASSIEGARFVQAHKPGGRLDFGHLLSRRDKVRPQGVDHLAIDLDADAAATLTAAAVGKVDLHIVYLWTDGSHLGTWHVAGAQISEPRAALSEVEDDAVRVAFDVDAVTFEEA